MPVTLPAELWHESGRWDVYGPELARFADRHGREFCLGPTHEEIVTSLVRNEVRSYRELPMRLAELGTVYRYERSGVMHGLMRVRGFTQDDAHIFCMPEQLESEVQACVEFAHTVLKTFGFDEYQVELSTSDPSNAEHYAGSMEEWAQAEAALTNTLNRMKIPFKTIPGEAAFYGPKIDIKLKDAIGRTWQCSTIQVDYNFPSRFGLTYRTAENT